MADRFRTALDWADVRVFATLARHGSLSATARALGVNHATVARRLAGLEQALGSKLFERRSTGYQLTTAGRRALEPAAAMENAAGALGRLGPEPSLAGLVRITATPSLAETFLIPRLRALHKMHPALDFEILAERQQASLPRHQSDIALRLGRPERGDILARRVARIGYGFYGTREWRDRLKGGSALFFIGFDEAGARFPEAQWMARRLRDARLVLRANYQTGQISAACAGFGIALLPHFFAASEPTLVEVRLPEVPPARELWLLTRRDVRHRPQLRAVADFLADLFRSESLLFEGHSTRPLS
jgi:DNA-binding transcriptional LysR family regulator